ncbi:UPF0606 protein KIAA1549 [Aulostomus maculatus]
MVTCSLEMKAQFGNIYEDDGDESLLSSTHDSKGFPGDDIMSTGSSPSALTASHSTAFESRDTPGGLPSLPQPNHEARTADSMLFQWGHVLSENYKSSSQSDLVAEEPQPLSTPSLSPSKPVSGSFPSFEAPAKLSTDWKLAREDSAKQYSFPLQTPTSSQLQPQSNISTTPISSPAFTPQLSLTSEHKAVDDLDTASQQAIPGQLLEPPKRDLADFLSDDSHILDHVSLDPELPLNAPSENQDGDQLSPSSGPKMENKAVHYINMLPNPEEILAPSYHVPFIGPHPTSPSSAPTEVPPEDYYPTNTMELDWGSGDYMETMSFLSPEGDDYSLATKVPTDTYDLEDYAEKYDTSFPSRVGKSLSSWHPFHIAPSPSVMAAYSTMIPLTIHPSSLSSVQSTIQYPREPTPTFHSDREEMSDIDWSDTFSIQPTDILLPDMNSLEYYTTRLTKEDSVESGAEQRGNVTVVSIATTDITHSSSTASNKTEDESSSDLSGFEPHNETTTMKTAESPGLVSEPSLHPYTVTPPLPHPFSSIWGGQMSPTDWPASTHAVALGNTSLTAAILPSVTALLPDEVMPSLSLTDIHWFVTESVPLTTVHSTPVLTATTSSSLFPTEGPVNATAGPTQVSHQDTSSTTTQALNNTVDLVANGTLVPPVMVGDEGVTEAETDIPATMTLIPASSPTNADSAAPATTTATTTSHQAATGAPASSKASTSVVSTASGKTPTVTPTPRQYLCNLDKPDYLVKIGFPSGATVGYAKSQIRDILKGEFNKSVELQVLDPPPKFMFRVVSGPVVYTAISVINALRRSGRRFLSLSPEWDTPDNKYQVHTVLQFVPGHIDVRFCNFSESIERGLTLAFAEVRRRSKDSTNFTVHIVNITMAAPKNQEQRLVRQPVDITFTVRTSRGYLMGSEVSNALMKLTMVEFSYYMGFPVLQIAEPFHYPKLNTSQFLRSSWVRTVLLGVPDNEVSERTFQANMERRVAMLLGEAMGLVRRVKRATTVGNSSVQVVTTSRLEGADHPMEVVFFMEGPSGQRIPAVETANLLNSLDVQKAAIVLGYRVQGILAQPVEKLPSSPSDTENTNMWIIIGVVIPLLVVIIIISILYWKLCRTDKLEFQPDAMTSIQQRQKLQAPSVKGFDFAKLHLGQQSKDDVMVIQEPIPPGPGPGPLPLSVKDGFSPSENGEIPTPISKNSASSTKASRSSRRRGRISPSDGDSMVSDHSSERESMEENLRAQATPSDSKQTRKNRIGPPPLNDTKEQLSSAAIFEHVDRMSRATDTSRRLPNKVQLIAMQPMPVPPLQSPTINGKLSNSNQINKEIQAALRHKSEIEHHRNKIRLRAKRKGHYDFPAMDDVSCGLGDPKDQDRIYQKAQIQIDKILDPNTHMPSIFMEPKRSVRGRRSPKQRLKEQLNGGMMDADKDHLITEDTDAAYRKCPGVNNVAYVSDPDQGPGSIHRSPSPTDDVFLGPASSPPGHAPPPPPYMPPQPSIEEARQQMHSLLDDAFALVSPTSQGSTAGITLPGVSTNPSDSSPPGRGPRLWGPPYQGLGPFPGRFTELSVSPPAVQGLMPRQGHGLSYLPPGEPAGHGEQLQPDCLFSSRGLYADELTSSARPRPVGGTTGTQLHHLAQVGLSSRLNGYPAGVRGPLGHNGGIGWNNYHDDNFSRPAPDKDVVPRSVIREPSAPPAHLDTGPSYMSAPPPMDPVPPTHSSASLIKAIREELLRLSQKQAAVSSYHS